MIKNKRATKLQYWKELNQAFESSGLKQKAFCLSQGINYKAFSNHRYRLKQTKDSSLHVTKNVMSTENKSLFIPIKLKPVTEVNIATIKSPLILLWREKVQLQIPAEMVSIELLRTIFDSLGAS